ncbi:ABC transporter permease [Parabacteroides sp. BX2]|jgi:hypothetical protein|uniref:ABC transporter permease n=1 Tax=Parabacteroides segnis TaxID=2763058 RepID=A0ABR7E6D5_9BACT|nr:MULTISPECIES: FtsX-like permease family protein [Parabacteroides]MBC5645342.1 ABC transporter permease [Parabacteroides segnis]MCM0715207.1 ABC transporter permease [Parabacteroides sp. TA-V-105]
MIKHILKIIWNQRRSNGWIFAELLVVVAILWVMMDSMLVDQYTYHSPLGFDIRNTYKIQLGVLQPGMPGYVDEQEQATRLGEDMFRLVDNLRQAPEVDEVCLAGAGSPYSLSRMSTLLVPVGADTTVQARNYTYCTVTPEYFDVLRITDKAGAPLRSVVGTRTGIAISADLEEQFLEGGGMGDSFQFDGEDGERLPLVGISNPRRSTEYEKSAPYFYEIVSPSAMIDVAEMWQVTIDVLIRMSPGFPPEKMEAFLQGMGDRLLVNNVYVSSLEPLSDMRADRLKDREDNMKKKIALVGFMLINVFFGIIGTFWLRTQARQGEMGLRIALGSNRRQLSRLMNLEGLVLLALTIPFVLVFILNMLYFDMPDTYRLPYTWWRFAVTFGGAYLLMAGMISLGIWFPMHKAVQMKPAEALHYE